MTAVPDPAELAPTRDPAAYRRRPLLGPAFWLVLAFSALCLLAAVAVVTLAPRLLAVRPSPSPASPAPPAPLPTPYPLQLPATPAPAPAGADLTLLSARVQRLEANQDRALEAAAEALAAATLSEAAAQPRPFLTELVAFERLLPRSGDALALAPLAQQGAPTRTELAAQLADIAARVSVAAHAPGRHASVLDQIAYAVSRVVTIRHVDPGGAGPDAALARAVRRAADGDLEGAVGLLDSLPPSTRATVAPWREQALRRIEIDQHIAGLRAQAVADLTAAQAPPNIPANAP